MFNTNYSKFSSYSTHLKVMTRDETDKIKALEIELNESEEHLQMNTLEKKWNNQQQTNQVDF